MIDQSLPFKVQGQWREDFQTAFINGYDRVLIIRIRGRHCSMCSSKHTNIFDHSARHDDKEYWTLITKPGLEKERLHQLVSSLALKLCISYCLLGIWILHFLLLLEPRFLVLSFPWFLAELPPELIGALQAGGIGTWCPGTKAGNPTAGILQESKDKEYLKVKQSSVLPQFSIEKASQKESDILLLLEP